MNNEFIRECEEVADSVGVEILDSYEDGTRDGAFEDDGLLHVTRGNTRVAFDVSNNQRRTNTHQNAYTRDILGMLGIPVTEDALA